MLTLAVHLVMVGFLQVPPTVLQEGAMLAMAVTMLVCALLLCGVREGYSRRKYDAQVS